MVICIEEFLQKVQPRAFLVTKVATSLEWIDPKPDGEAPDDWLDKSDSRPFTGHTDSVKGSLMSKGPKGPRSPGT
jgi:hypothetical protein